MGLMASPVDQLTLIEQKLDQLVQRSDVLTSEEVDKVREALAFVKVFRGDAATLQRMESLFVKFENWLSISKWMVGLMVGTVVVLSNWDRFVEYLRSYLE